MWISFGIPFKNLDLYSVSHLWNHLHVQVFARGPIVCLSFFDRDVHGDFGTYSAPAISPGYSWTIWGGTALTVVSSENLTPGLVAIIVFA